MLRVNVCAVENVYVNATELIVYKAFIMFSRVELHQKIINESHVLIHKYIFGVCNLFNNTFYK